MSIITLVHQRQIYTTLSNHDKRKKQLLVDLIKGYIEEMETKKYNNKNQQHCQHKSIKE